MEGRLFDAPYISACSALFNSGSEANFDAQQNVEAQATKKQLCIEQVCM
jgi:hypothetical protein